MNNIIDFGAIGDGITLNTKAIQEAINAGGMVYIPAGVFRTGTLYLKSNGWTSSRSRSGFARKRKQRRLQRR